MEKNTNKEDENNDLRNGNSIELNEVQAIEIATLESLGLPQLEKSNDQTKSQQKRSSRKSNTKTIRLKRDADGARTYPYGGQKKKSKQSLQIDTQSISDDGWNVQDDHNPCSSRDAQSDTSDNCCDDPPASSEEIGTLSNFTNVLDFELLKKHKKRKTWSERKKVEEEQWKEERESIFSAVLRSYSNEGLCCLCYQNPISVKCHQCVEKKFCNACDQKTHQFETLHDRVAYVDGFASPMLPSEIIGEDFSLNEKCSMVPLLPTSCSVCNDKETLRIPTDYINVVTLSGKYLLRLFTTQCLGCGHLVDPFQDIQNIVESGFWPNSPKRMSYLFDQELFRFWDILRKNAPGTSENAFLEVLNTMSKFHGRSGKITPAIFSTAFKEWCFCQYKIDCLQHKDWMECPACVFEQHSSHVDGNCKLYHYKSSGVRTRPEFYNGLFIVEDAKVKTYIQNLYQGKFGKVQKDVRCGGVWNAARNTARNKKSLDVTGLEVMSCRHQLGQKALNMHQGELYGYALYLIKHHMIPRKVNFVFADVMCKLSKFVERVDPETAKKFLGALSVMHAKGHGLDCQVLWDGEWVDGTGRSTGEETEQIFSFLSRFCNTTKYQKPENREETLTEMILFWNKRKIEVQAEYLVKKYNQVQADLLKHQKDVDSSLNKFDIQPDFTELKNEIRAIATKIAVPPASSLSHSAQILLLFHELKGQVSHDEFGFLESICPELPDLSVLNIQFLQKKKEDKIKLLRALVASAGITRDNVDVDANEVISIVTVGYQRQIENTYFERVHWVTRIRKIADTSKQRFVLRKKAAKASTSMQKLVTSYNTFARVTVTFDDVIKGSFQWITELQHHFYPLGFTDIEKRCVLISFLKKERCEEELEILKFEMKKYLRFYGNKCLAMEQEIGELENSEFSGKLILIREGYLFAQKMLRQALILFQGIIPDANIAEEIDEEEEDGLCESIETNEVEMFDEENEENDEVDSSLDRGIILSTGKGLMNDLPINKEGGVVKLPSDLSQARLNGRNGSSACTTISLLVGHFMPRSMSDWCSTEVLECFVGCIDVGNYFHRNRTSTAVDESLDLLPDDLKALVTISEFRNPLFGELYNNINGLTDGYVIVTGKGRSFCCVLRPDFLIAFDSHLHGEFGATITLINNQQDFASNWTYSNNDMLDICYITYS